MDSPGFKNLRQAKEDRVGRGVVSFALGLRGDPSLLNPLRLMRFFVSMFFSFFFNCFCVISENDAEEAAASVWRSFHQVDSYELFAPVGSGGADIQISGEPFSY